MYNFYKEEPLYTYLVENAKDNQIIINNDKLAEILNVPIITIIRWRKSLEKLGLIKCTISWDNKKVIKIKLLLNK